MIELLVLIVGIVALWKGSGAISSLMYSAEETANAFAEDVVAEKSVERIDRVEDFKARVGDREVLSHDSAMDLFRGK